MIKFENKYGIEVVDSFLRLYEDLLKDKFSEIESMYEGSSQLPSRIEFLPLDDNENYYDDVVVKLDNKIYISGRQVGRIGFSIPEMYAALAHELGHILYRTHPWRFDAEERADSLAAEIGLGSQMISAIEKIIASRRFSNMTGALVRRIQFLKHLA